MILALQRVFCTIKDNFPLAKNEEVLDLPATIPPAFPFVPDTKVSLSKRSVSGRMLLKTQLGLDNLPVHLIGFISVKTNGPCFQTKLWFSTER